MSHAQARQMLGDRVLLARARSSIRRRRGRLFWRAPNTSFQPTLNLDVIRMCRRYDKLVMPGAFTPTEILSAWEAGADIVKVFPADVVGPAFFKAMRGPLPQIRVMPTGGVDLKTAATFLQAGGAASAHRAGDLLPLDPAARDRPADHVRLPVAVGHRLVLVLAGLRRPASRRTPGVAAPVEALRRLLQDGRPRPPPRTSARGSTAARATPRASGSCRTSRSRWTGCRSSSTGSTPRSGCGRSGCAR